MEAARDSAPNLRLLALALYAFPNRKGQRSLQFSFVTKLANTIDPTCPIYDSWVAALCGFRPPACGLEVEDRIDRLLEFHGWLGLSYDQALSAGSIGGMVDRFRRTYSANDEMVPDAKVVDFICWSAGSMGLKQKYWELVRNGQWPAYRVVTPAKGVDSIIECNLAEDFDFADLGGLTARIEANTAEFVAHIESFLSEHDGV